MARKPIIGVIGGGSTASREGIALAEEVGFLIARADAIVAVNGSYGTLSEMAHAFDLGKTVFALRTWPMDKAGVEPSLFVPVDTPREAVERALAYARKAMDAEKPGPGPPK